MLERIKKHIEECTAWYVFLYYYIRVSIEDFIKKIKR